MSAIEPEMTEAMALPRKSFFVDMLTRDIELQDVLLDLLDNCVDGILRSTKVDMKAARPYDGRHAVIVVSEDNFRITDNCGGIPIEIAINQAFAIGRPAPIEGEEAIATVGKYGIGMKRAIFKLGRQAKVRSWSDEPFEVTISPDWMGSDGWDPLPLQKLMPGSISDRGTSIEVTRLDPAIAKVFARKEFVEEFKRIVARQYSIIIGKGFSVHIAYTEANVAAEMLKPVPAEPFGLLISDPTSGSKERVEPFIYEGIIDGVAVEIYAGLYRRLPTDEEREEEEETKGQTDDAGWTVACNDRIVIWKDRGRLTGWGEATVPNYHGQFIAITGIVLMHAEDLDKLPLTTTKRGIDAGSDVYSKCKDLMREATKHLISFTNKWKNHSDELETIYLGSRQLRLPDLKAEAEQLREKGAMSAVRTMPSVSRRMPALPQPAKAKTHARVGFNAPRSDIVKLAIAYFDDAEAKPGAVGEQAFVRELARVGRS